MAEWNKDATQRYLSANPLPVTFRMRHRDDPAGTTRPVLPSHKSITDYGKWLRETPYFEGLFERCHAILAAAEDLGDSDWLAAELVRQETNPSQDKLPLL